MFKGKIFCLGLNKTGTTSLHEAFKILGFKSVHFNCDKGWIKYIIKNNYENGDKLLLGIEDYDVYSEWVLPDTNHLFKEIDNQYPNSKFILTIRDFNSWLVSREKHVKRTPNLKELQNKYPNSAWLNIDKKAWKKERQEFHKDVFSYFKNRPNDLLVMNICAGDGWEKLCHFLKVPMPNKSFPHKNKKPKLKYLISLKRLYKKIVNLIK